MRKKDISQSINFASVCLFKDDLEVICKILEEYKLQYKIDLDEYEISSTDFSSISEVDLKQKKSYGQITLQARKKDEFHILISLRANQYGSSIDYEDDIHGVAAAHKLEEILEKRVRKLAYLKSNFPIIFFLLWCILLILRMTEVIDARIYLFSLAIMMILGILVEPIISKNIKVVFIPENSSIKRGIYKYFSRNKDEIFSQVISNFIILVVGFLLGRWTD